MSGQRDGHDDVRKRVSEFYGGLVTEPADGCCGSGAAGGVAAAAGYDGAELEAVPADAAGSSFGCGNPLALAEVGRGEVVLDLGAGAGLDVILAANRVGPTGRVVGVDMTDAMIAKARANIAAAGLANAEIRKGLIEDLPVESASVDLVISNCVINLSPDKPRVFAEIARVLKPGGRMLVSDIVVEDLPDEVRRNPTLYVACVAGAIGEAEYVAGLGRAGLVDVEVRDRLVYDAAQLAALVGAEIPDLAKGLIEGGATADDLRRLAEAVSGKVWSAKFFARRPPLAG